MQDFLRAGLILVCLLLVFIHGTAAWNVTQLTVYPSGQLTPWTPVIITGTIDFIPSSYETFPSSHELQFSTELEKAKWNSIIVLDGVEAYQPSSQGKLYTISGWWLSYPKNVHESVRFKLEGKAPSVIIDKAAFDGRQIQNITLVRIQEVDGQGILVPETFREYSASVVNIRDDSIDYNISIDKRLEEFRSHIDEKASLGINTTLAEAIYVNAKVIVKNAKALPSAQYKEAYELLDSVRDDMKEGERLLDKAWAEKAVADAQKKVDQMDALIGWYKGNGSTANDAVLPSVVTRREVAMAYLTTANDEIANGNYDLARLKAQEAYNKANESYTNGNSRNDRTEGSDRLFPLYITACIIVTILLVIGIVWWRKRKGAKPE